ncbi:MAG: antibiotic biosynthesis monooxygenase [Chloroflexi bacterium]|jgi:heme-degrading monooxygenase HmoA|nr:antibiotic biosynthesis monooxygenase [Chloroflexota bacterium]MBO41276.1 antibiotic biosynthesis monooxygenase [Chloroflexota bacterium]|tara:strand:- start:3725 stop:4054 length:330 start_codon:yes stop_codon:yes gene_type:complete
MFIAMNAFKVKKDSGDAFEAAWKGRDSYLNEVPGIIHFSLLRGEDDEEGLNYSSHTIWESKGDFESWTQSEAFVQSHRGGGTTTPLLLGHPQVSLWDAVIEQDFTSKGD